MKKVLLTAVATLGLATATIAQTAPSYLPTNGLVGWWPFNGNANDESGNGNNGTVNGATLTTDRFGNAGKAYSFDGTSNYIDGQFLTPILTTGNGLTFATWVNFPIINSLPQINLTNNNGSGYGIWSNIVNGNRVFSGLCGNAFVGPSMQINDVNSPSINTWYSVVLTCDLSTSISKLYVNGFIVDQSNAQLVQASLDLFTFGKWPGNNVFLTGNLDDIGIWNRALTQQEITDLHNAVNCNLTITPQTNSLQIGNTATFNATTSDVNPTHVWQSDFGQGFVTLNNYGNYSGINTNTLSIANVQLANHNQPIRAISTSGNCVDTSNVAYINIADTCITTVYDTVTTYISVTDTLFINVNTVGLNNTTIVNTIKVFPNPANSHLNLDFGNFNNLNGYSIKIYNSLSQVIYNQAITQQSETIYLSTFGGNGIYFLHVINAQNNTVEIRKIVLQ
jgi:hypothetical protein